MARKRKKRLRKMVCDEEGEEENKDSSDDESKSLNADSADKIVRQRLSICRVGDKLNMDGLEDMSIKQAKKAIIAKVLPTMRMDGKSDAYIDAMYDLAVNEANKHKGSCVSETADDGTDSKEKSRLQREYGGKFKKEYDCKRRR